MGIQVIIKNYWVISQKMKHQYYLLQQSKIDQFFCQNERPMASKVLAKINNHLAQWIAQSGRPISIVED